MTFVNLFPDDRDLQQRIRKILYRCLRAESGFAAGRSRSVGSSAVMFLLGRQPGWTSAGEGPCLVLNKRSDLVKQPGDLCCPGGGIDLRLDRWGARLLHLPLTPLTRWPFWRELRRERRRTSQRLSLLLATGLREAAEEMRLNPLGIDFLGPLPPQRLVMFQREIYPLVGWIRWQKRFFPNWEVERLVFIPLRQLLDPGRYARFRLTVEGAGNPDHYKREFPCFRYGPPGARELLWGATFRICMVFLKLVFDFTPPDQAADLPIVEGTLKESYFTGNG